MAGNRGSGTAPPVRAVGPMPTSPPAKFPNAKTYKDRQGNVREVGTGRLLRRAGAPARPSRPAASSKPKTYVDGQGVVRRVGTAANGRPSIAVNPLDRRVDSEILVQSTPLNNQLGDASRQSAAAQAAINASRDANAQIISEMQRAMQAYGQAALTGAAQQAGGTASAQQQNLEYLRGLLGADLGAGSVADLAGAAQGEIAGTGTGGFLSARGSVRDAADMGMGNTLQSGNLIADQMTAYQSAKRDLEDKIAAIKANRSGIRNDLIDRGLDQQAARQEIRLAQAQFDESKRQFDESLDAEITAGELGAAPDPADSNLTAYSGIRMTKAQAGSVQTAIASWREGGRKTLGSFLANVKQLGGVNKVMAARLAMAVLTPAELKRYAGSRAAFVRMMTQSGVKGPVAKAWANRIYGTPNRPGRVITEGSNTVGEGDGTVVARP